MEKLTGCFLLLVVLNFVSAEDAFFGENRTLELRPRFSEEITSIQWKHNSNLVAEWVKAQVDLLYYGEFNGRTNLDEITGRLKIENMRPADSGVYSVEINNRVQPERYNAKLIKAVRKPSVSVKPLACGPTSDECTLHCEGNTTDTGPVTYSWKMGGGNWTDGEKVRSIINNETTQSVKTFSCRMKNPISEKVSDPKPNPFFREKGSGSSGVGLGVGLFLLFAALAGLGIGGYLKREDIKKKISPKPVNAATTVYASVRSNEDKSETRDPPSSQPASHSGEANNGKTGEANNTPPASSHGDGP